MTSRCWPPSTGPSPVERLGRAPACPCRWATLPQAGRGRRAVGVDGPTRLAGYALMAWACFPLLLMLILRGLARSATGMRSVSTPAS